MKAIKGIKAHIRKLVNQLNEICNEAQYKTQLEAIEVYRSNIESAKLNYIKR